MDPIARRFTLPLCLRYCYSLELLELTFLIILSSQSFCGVWMSVLWCWFVLVCEWRRFSFCLWSYRSHWRQLSFCFCCRIFWLSTSVSYVLRISRYFQVWKLNNFYAEYTTTLIVRIIYWFWFLCPFILVLEREK